MNPHAPSHDYRGHIVAKHTYHYYPYMVDVRNTVGCYHYMPKLNGYEVLQKMRSNALLASVPVIMITGNEDDDARIKALMYGTNNFVVKPYNADVLRHCLHNSITFYEVKAMVDSLGRDSVTGLYNREAVFEQVKHCKTKQDMINWKNYRVEIGCISAVLLQLAPYINA